MKKLITGAVAAIAILFGFAACSGEYSKDLHENDVQPLAIVGLTSGYTDSENYCVAMTIPDGGDGSEQYLTFKLSKDTKLKCVDGEERFLTPWGGLGSPEFKIVPSTEINSNANPTWKVDWGWETDTGKLFVKPGEDYKALLMRGDKGTSAAGPSNVTIDGATMNEIYTIRVKYNANSVSLKIEGPSSDPSAMNFNIVGTSKNFPAKDEDGNDLSYSMEKAGTTYTYDFISVADEDVEFSLKNDLAGTFGGVLGKDASDLALNADSTTNLKLSTKKNVEYKITVDTSKGINKATIKYEVVPMLKNAALNADWKYSNVFYEVDAKDSVYFKAENKNLQFIVNRISGDNKFFWGAGTVNSIVVDGDATELKYTDVGDKKAPGLISVKDLKENGWYEIKLEADDDSFNLKVKVEELQPVVFPENMGLMIWFNTDSGWSNSKYLKLTKDGDHAYSCDVKAEGSVDDMRFDFVTGGAAPDWNDRWGVQTEGGEISLGERHGPFMNSEPKNRDKLTGTSGKTYHFEIDTSGGVWCTITETE